ncbi:C39 family peptidase [Eubacteriales bacterium OttesenSCG-928-N13]|nr:C39 family peptidase [Eubacteriales bacterium OttesenSCG-928-N13]
MTRQVQPNAVKRSARRWALVLLCILLALGAALALRPIWYGMDVPRLMQTDYPDAVCTIAGQPRSVQSSGCGATCVSIVGQYLSGRRDLSPSDLFLRAYEQGDYFGDGLGHEALLSLLSCYGLRGSWPKNDIDTVLSSLKRGKPVIAHMGNGTFSRTGGHYIVLRGIAPDGRIWVHDPYKQERSEQPYEMKELLRQVKTGASFLLIES